MTEFNVEVLGVQLKRESHTITKGEDKGRVVLDPHVHICARTRYVGVNHFSAQVDEAIKTLQALKELLKDE